MPKLLPVAAVMADGVPEQVAVAASSILYRQFC
jgi:hypothetical protein